MTWDRRARGIGRGEVHTEARRPGPTYLVAEREYPARRDIPTKQTLSRNVWFPSLVSFARTKHLHKHISAPQVSPSAHYFQHTTQGMLPRSVIRDRNIRVAFKVSSALFYALILSVEFATYKARHC